MKNVSQAFIAMLQSSQTLVEADLYTITLASGTVLRYTSAQQAISYGGNVYPAAYLDSAPGFTRGTTKCAIGLESDTLEVDLLFDNSTNILGQLPSQFAAEGGFDNAVLRLDKALAPDWSNPVVNGAVNLFVGYIGESKIDPGKIALTVNSRPKILNTSFPRNYFLPQCNHALFDSGCTLSKASYAVNGTVGPGTNTPTSFATNCTQADGWFALGSVVWVTGANAGVVSFVKSYANASGQFTLAYPISQPQPNDTFTAYPGCDKLQATCSAKFNNTAHFRGFPYVPTPETLELGQAGAPPASAGSFGGAGVVGLGRGSGGQIGRFEQV